MFCKNCNGEMPNDVSFCPWCGAKADSGANNTYTPPLYQQKSPQDYFNEEQEFLDVTHRLLRWERKAWSIAGNVFIILGAVFAAIYFIIAIVGAFVVSYESAGFIAVFIGILYSLIFGGMFITIGIIGKKAAEKIVLYLNTVYSDFTLSYNRCGSVGMLVFTIFFNEIAFVFFLINFVRMKSNKEVISRIIARQRGNI